MNEAERRIRGLLLGCLPLAVIAIVIPVCAYFSVLLPPGEDGDVWFQRSGSLTVLVTVWLEFRLIKVNEEIRPFGQPSGNLSAIREKYLGIYTLAQIVAVFLAVFGTFIWGYGDFFKKYI